MWFQYVGNRRHLGSQRDKISLDFHLTNSSQLYLYFFISFSAYNLCVFFIRPRTVICISVPSVFIRGCFRMEKVHLIWLPDIWQPKDRKQEPLKLGQSSTIAYLYWWYVILVIPNMVHMAEEVAPFSNHSNLMLNSPCGLKWIEVLRSKWNAMR